jgi:hypothetical protein
LPLVQRLVLSHCHEAVESVSSVRVVRKCGAAREIPRPSLARLAGWKVTLKELAARMRCSRCGKKAAEVVAVARPRPRA